MQKLKIQSVVKQSVGDLSGGQQQRISIARVLSKKPKIIFADEPTGNLDKDTANDVMSVIFDYIQEVSGALVLVTHDEIFSFRQIRGKTTKNSVLKRQDGLLVVKEVEVFIEFSYFQLAALVIIIIFFVDKQIAHSLSLIKTLL